MKSIKWRLIPVLCCTLMLLALSLHAQDDAACQTLFSPLAEHTRKSCEHKEFAELEVYAKAGAKADLKKGDYIKVAYAFNGAFDKRPAATQIYENYANAIKKARGEVTVNNGNGIWGKLKKGGDSYWIKVYTDGSSWYWYESVKEAALRQDVTFTPEEIKNNLKAEGKAVFYGIYFDTDKATVKSESAPALTAIAAFLKTNPSTNVYIVGHTDNSGSFEHNLTLSKDRATAVVTELAGTYGVNKSQLMAQGVASLAPVAANDTDAGKAKNRRVELVKR
ncbi:MAG TPA: OmpA family protein [Chitinophagaceae bacterium]|nr:OmpA family protein [Chitinophagaceae bacterium]